MQNKRIRLLTKENDNDVNKRQRLEVESDDVNTSRPEGTTSILPPVLLSIVCSYLPADELIPLMKIYPLSINKTLFGRITSRLLHHDLGKDFLDALRQSKGVISGSFIPDTLTGDHAYRDIDVYVLQWNQEQFTPIEQYLYARCEERRKADAFTMQLYHHLARELAIRHVRAYTIKSGSGNLIVVQVISVNSIREARPDHWFDMSEHQQEEWQDAHRNRNIRDFLYSEICRTFDFQFLMNAYDGDTLQLRYPESIHNKCGPNLRIARLPCFDPTTIELRSDLDDPSWPTLIHVRCLKYLARGYDIHNFIKPDVIRIKTSRASWCYVRDTVLPSMVDPAWKVRFEVDEEQFLPDLG